MKFGPPRGYRAYADLIADPDVEAVYIPLPNSQHRLWAIRAADRGKHVLCEKPIALHAIECREIMAAAKANKVNVMEAFMYRYSERTRMVIEVLTSGVLGEIKFVSSHFHFLLSNPDSIKYKQELGGGSLYDVGCYPVNFIGLVTDEMARSACGFPAAVLPEAIATQYVKESGVDVVFSALLKYPSGLMASLSCGFKSQLWMSSFILGTKGSLEVPETFLGSPGNVILTTEDNRKEIPIEESDRYRLEVEDFADGILDDRPPLLSLNESMRNMEVLDKLHTASRTGIYTSAR